MFGALFVRSHHAVMFSLNYFAIMKYQEAKIDVSL